MVFTAKQGWNPHSLRNPISASAEEKAKKKHWGVNDLPADFFLSMCLDKLTGVIYIKFVSFK